MSKNKKSAEAKKEEKLTQEAELTEEAKELDKEANGEAETEQQSEVKEEVKSEQSAELAALNDRYLRICAEYDNFRKRSQKEKDSLYCDIKADTLNKFLPVYDNLVRALAQPTEDEAYRKGVEMIMNQFNSTMQKLGVTEIDCLGKSFDPAFHNAVMHVDDEEKGDNEIVEVFQKGFMIGDKVIRFAMVKVAN